MKALNSESLSFVEPALEQYCIDHSLTPSAVGDELASFTRQNVPHSIMLTGPLEGSFLGWIMNAIGAKSALDIGTYTGYSALWMAERLPADGRVVTLDLSNEHLETAQKFWNRSPAGKKIEFISGAAQHTLEKLKGPFDFVFIDANKTGYAGYLDAALKLLSPKGVIACDNCLYQGQVLEKNPEEENARAIKKFNDYVAGRKDLISCLLPIRDGIFLIVPKRS